MYEPSVNFYSTVIQAQTRRLVWHGTLTDTDGTVHSFTAKDIADNSGTLTKACASSTEIALGTVYSAELKIGLYIDDIGVSRSKIYGGQITLTCTASTGDGLTSGDVPVGVFNITEATQSGDLCTITAYDNMIKFDKAYLGVSGIATPYDWAQSFCQSCGVTFGMEQTEVEALPNGTLSLTLIWNDDIETYRDALSHLAAAVGSVATIDRNGELRFLPLASVASVATVTANDRFGSDIAHTSYRPKTAYVTIEETGKLITQTSGSGNAYLDLGTNALLQVDGRVRNQAGETLSTYSPATMLGNIITAAATFVSVPIEADIPCDPCLDLLDCITLTGGQAASGGTVMRLTSIELKIGKAAEIKCAGSNTAEAKTAEERASSNKDGSNALLMWQSFGSNSAQLIIDVNLATWGRLAEDTWDDISSLTWGSFTAGGTEETVVEVSVTPKKDWAKGLLNFTVNYSLDDTATITYRVYVDNEVNWELTETQEPGEIVKTITTTIDLWSNTETVHDIKVTMAGDNR